MLSWYRLEPLVYTKLPVRSVRVCSGLVDWETTQPANWCGNTEQLNLLGEGSGGRMGTIRRCGEQDFETIWAVIQDGAQAYRGVIPADRWSDPYLSREKLQHEIDAGVEFWGLGPADDLEGVMGIQQIEDVTLIRHAYVRTLRQGEGIGTRLLEHLRAMARGPLLIGAWADAAWAIRFYERHGFQMVGQEEKVRLLKRYWTVPERQIETSVVLADARWRAAADAETLRE